MAVTEPRNIAKGHPHVLLVEDSEADAQLIRTQVKKIWPDCVITTVDTLAKAYDAYLHEKLDILLLDLNLPDGFGPRAVEEVMSFVRKVPVVVITSMGSRITTAEALKCGAKAVMYKDHIITEEFTQLLQESIKN